MRAPEWGANCPKADCDNLPRDLAPIRPTLPANAQFAAIYRGLGQNVADQTICRREI
jgi:hypothetical protein